MTIPVIHLQLLLYFACILWVVMEFLGFKLSWEGVERMQASLFTQREREAERGTNIQLAWQHCIWS